MKLLLDANISWRLTKLLSDYCDKVLHLENAGLKVPARDVDIWDYAKRNEFVIVTNDEDFLNLLLRRGFPPKIILLKTGNQSTRGVAELLEKNKDKITELVQTDHLGLLEIF